MSYNQVAKSVRQNKEKYPEKFCWYKDCLWRVTRGNSCLHHGVRVMRSMKDRSQDYFMSFSEVERLVTEGKLFYELTNQCYHEETK